MHQSICTQLISFHFCSFSSPPQVIPIIITLVTEEGGSDELLRNVEEEIQTLGMQLNINITIDGVDRFGKTKPLQLLYMYYTETIPYIHRWLSFYRY